MDNKFESIINSCPYSTQFSRFEQENFNSPSSPGYPRYVIGLINQYRKIESDFEFESRNFERNVLMEEKGRIESILREQDIEKMENAIANWQQVEAEYWTDTLGKIAAIEILTQGKTSYETMLKMVKLPTELYVKATQVCLKLANAVKDTTVKAEVDLGIVPESDLPTTVSAPAAVPKKLFLKKTK